MPYSHVGAGIHPLDQFVPVHDHALADRDCREALGVHQFVGVGLGNAEHRGHLTRVSVSGSWSTEVKMFFFLSFICFISFFIFDFVIARTRSREKLKAPVPV